MVAVSVGIAREVEPLHGHALAELRQGEEAIHLFLVGVGGLVGEEGIEFGGGGRESGEVEGDAAQQGGAVGFGRGLEAFAFEAGQHQAVDWGACPLVVVDGRHGGAHGRYEGPVACPLGALLDPFAYGGDLRLGERGPGLTGRHASGGRGADAGEETALRGVAGGDDAIGSAVGEQALFGIEAEVRHAVLVVGTVTGEAVVGQDGAHVAIEID